MGEERDGAGELRDGREEGGGGVVLMLFFSFLGVVWAISRPPLSADILRLLQTLDYIGVKKLVRAGFWLVPPTLHPY